MSRNEVKVLSALPLVGHPRDSKRISMLKGTGFSIEAVAFNRPYHSGRLPDCPVIPLGDIKSGEYTRRLLRIAKVVPLVRRAVKQNDIVYASGTDMAFLALVAGFGLRKPVIIEIGDIREVQLRPGRLGRLVRKLDKWIVDHCALLVVTAPKFLDVYYREWLNSTVPALVIENKLEAEYVRKILATDEQKFKESAGKELPERIRIGYFGGLRCEWSWNVLRQLATSHPKKFQIVLAGLPMIPPNLVEMASRYGNVEYLGEYRSPQDLQALYQRIDLVWACYKYIGPDDWNLRWARPNRFYESCLFGKPLISRAGSCDAVEVKKLDIGVVIEEQGVDTVVERIAAITSDDLTRWKRNASALPRDVYTYTSEAEDLAHAVCKIVGKDADA